MQAACDALGTPEGVCETALPGTVCVHESRRGQLEARRWRACLAMVVHGRKDLVLGSQRHILRPGDYTFTPLPLAVASRISRAPFVALLVGLDTAMLGRIVAEMDARDDDDAAIGRGLFFGTLDAPMRDAAARLCETLCSAEASTVLGPGHVRELVFHALRGPHGPGIRRFLCAGTDAHRIGVAVRAIEANLAERLDVDALAAAASLSRTTFYAQFKRVTAHSPVQFQKRLRLLEAQRLLVQERTTAEDAAFRVGYASASQFSRDYARMFGQPPMRHLGAITRA